VSRPVRVLAIDGGGIRGIIPALALLELERLTDGARAAELFDLIAGTSTGGIIALGLTVPGEHGGPRYGAKELLDVYVERGRDIFPGGGRPTLRQRLLGPTGGRHLGRDIWGAGQRVGSLFGGNPGFAGNARYFPTGLEQVLATKFGDALLGAAVTPVAVTAYDMRGGAPVVFRSWEVAGGPGPKMRDVARATSAGPTYFPPQELEINGADAVLVDGGLAANNPALIAYTDALSLFAGREYVVVSLGTGVKTSPDEEDVTYDAIRSRDWLRTAAGVFSATMSAGSGMADQTLSRLLNRPSAPAHYWRIQTDVGPCSFAMDDASADNVRCLLATGERMIEAHATQLAEIAQHLRAGDAD
jgi:predicted acylesterase/phospholipase RssA